VNSRSGVTVNSRSGVTAASGVDALAESTSSESTVESPTGHVVSRWARLTCHASFCSRVPRELQRAKSAPVGAPCLIPSVDR
jgi:hypothetical protein